MPENIETISYIKVGENNHPIDAVTVGGKTAPDESDLLPEVSSSDNGKVLRVINGQWTLIHPAIIYTGDGTPSSNEGNDGDIYIQTNS
jgi:hypothetical protein